MAIAYIECSAGASGDMFLGAWLDLGVDEQAWRRILESLHVEGYKIELRRVQKNGIGALKVDVQLENSEIRQAEWETGQTPPDHYHNAHTEHRTGAGGHQGHAHAGEHDHNHDIHDDHDVHAVAHPAHRHLPDITRILDGSDLPEPVREKSKQAFQYLAEAESKVHGISPDKVHFHEVGAVDAIVDIVGSMAGWYLAGLPECYVSPIETGTGTVKSAHGVIPVPAPAAAILLEGMTTYSSGILAETVTPTGAAILKTLRKDEPLPMTRFEKSGYGAGSQDLAVANVLRIRLGEPVPAPKQGNDFETEDACVIEANIDDMTPEMTAFAVSKLLSLGAMDAWVTPIVMKKGRAAFQLHVLCDPKLREFFTAHIFRETTTIGVRHYPVLKQMLERRMIRVKTRYGPVGVKLGLQGTTVVNAAPEFEDCRKQAEAYEVPLREVYRAAVLAYEESLR